MSEREYIKKYGSPLYVYQKDILIKRCKELKEFSNKLEGELDNKILVNMHYSTKANANPEILKIVKENELKVDCMSPLEVRVNELAGFTYSDMLYVCNNISSDEMKFIKSKNILPCLDSISQVEEWGKLFPKSEIMIRINPGVKGVGHSSKVITSGKDTKFGIGEDNLPLLKETCNKYGLNLVGIHQHLGSLFLDDKIDDYIKGVESGLNIIKNNFRNIKIIDLGGGFGVAYAPNEKPLTLSLVGEKLVPVLQRFIKDYPTVKEFKFEPGRYIPCEAGNLIGTVTAIKKENNNWWIGTDIGMNQLVRPSMYDSYHEVQIITDNNAPIINANICGNICESGDILAKNRKIKLPSVGDLVIVNNVGAYGFSMASNYTGRPRPAEIMVDKNDVQLIRKRETIEQIIENLIKK